MFFSYALSYAGFYKHKVLRLLAEVSNACQTQRVANHRKTAVTLTDAGEAGGKRHQLDGLGKAPALRDWHEQDVHRLQQDLVNLSYVAV